MSSRNCSANPFPLSSGRSHPEPSTSPRPPTSNSTSTSPEELPQKSGRRRDSSSSTSNRYHHLNRCQPSASSSYLEFVDENENDKQVDLMKRLQNEIQTLKYENNELKFFLYVALKHVDVDERILPVKDKFQLELEAFAQDYLDESKLTKSLRLSLESATTMLQEAKWVQHHYEVRNREQELQIEELQKQVFELKTNELTSMMQAPSTDYRASRNNQNRSHRMNRPAERQRSLSTSGQTKSQNRLSGGGGRGLTKRGLPTILPDNYRESVATLPPILDTGPGAHPTDPPFWMHRKKVA